MAKAVLKRNLRGSMPTLKKEKCQIINIILHLKILWGEVGSELNLKHANRRK